MISFPPVSTIIYLHGFLSSPQSPKAIQTADYFYTHCPQTTLILPQLPSDLDATLHLITDLLHRHGPCHFIGSSLGGFLASWAVETFGGKAVLINPAAHPIRVKSQFIGWHENTYTGERFLVDEAAFTRLQSLEPQQVTPDRYWVLLQKGDELLDYRVASKRYQHCQLTIEEGGDHSFVQYACWLPRIIAFLGIGLE